ncbi:MAG TPA: hypothetical protein VMU99_06110 [Acidimicrobiales bacterium]|nr:hypothetical protein [Acidimicrobiales bacterium]
MKRPRSLLREPVVLGGGKGATLVLDAIYRFPDGFELELTRDGSPNLALDQRRSSNGEASDPYGRRDQFVGLQIGLNSTDGRGAMFKARSLPGALPALIVSRFWRIESGEETLWLWAAPFPRDGRFMILARWPDYEIAGEDGISTPV